MDRNRANFSMRHRLFQNHRYVTVSIHGKSVASGLALRQEAFDVSSGQSMRDAQTSGIGTSISELLSPLARSKAIDEIGGGKMPDREIRKRKERLIGFEPTTITLATVMLCQLSYSRENANYKSPRDHGKSHLRVATGPLAGSTCSSLNSGIPREPKRAAAGPTASAPHFCCPQLASPAIARLASRSRLTIT